MSELNVYHHELRPNEYAEFYLKYEADKVIAEIEENHKKEVVQLLILNREQANAANRLRDSIEQALCHHKYKRCLAMAKWCDAMKSYFNESGFFDVYANERMVFYERWHNRWLKIAEQFKDKEAKRCTQ